MKMNAPNFNLYTFSLSVHFQQLPRGLGLGPRARGSYCCLSLHECTELPRREPVAGWLPPVGHKQP